MRSAYSTTSKSVYDIVTERILDQLAKGVVPWRRPWAGAASAPKNIQSKKAYRGINAFLLSCAGYASPFWMTFRQAQILGGHVRKGERGMPVVFYKPLEVEDRETGEDKTIPLLRYSTVFNSSQCEGILIEKLVECAPRIEFEPIAACESILAGMPANRPALHHGSAGAFYRPAADEVHMPDRNMFDAVGHYYATLFHELAHATGHPSRLNREGITAVAPFGSPIYSKEELVAEMGSAYLCGHAGIDAPPLVENTAAYLASWISKLRGDSKLVIQAASAAQKAADWILNGAGVEGSSNDKGEEGDA